MALEKTLNETLTRAIRARDTKTANVVRMLKTRIQERRICLGSKHGRGRLPCILVS